MLFEVVCLNLFGQKIIDGNDQVFNSAYYATQWYLMPPKLRHVIHVIMICSTKTKGLTIGKLREVNMETCGNVTIFSPHKYHIKISLKFKCMKNLCILY